MSKLIFLSHIHEERELASLVKESLEDEFSGFVDIFVSSDGVTIPAGSHFLKRIENGLLNCCGAIFLISPMSINRNWINFELGAVWIRNKLNELNQGPEIPAIPFCHSGTEIGKLPQPLGNLNAVQGNISTQLQFAFTSIQSAVGGRGKLKTDFDELSSKIRKFESEYTIGHSLRDFFRLFTNNASQAYDLIRNNPLAERIVLVLKNVKVDQVDNLKKFESGSLKGYVDTEVKNTKMIIDSINGGVNVGDIEITINTDILIEHSELLKNL